MAGGGQLSERGVSEVVAELEKVALIELPSHFTDVTDRVEEVEAWAAPRVAVDNEFRRRLIDELARHPDPKVRGWLSSMVTPKIFFATAEPGTLYEQPGVPVTAENAPVRVALGLSARSTRGLGFLARRRVGSQPWVASTAWLFGEPQASAALSEWPSADGTFLPFWMQIDLEAAVQGAPPLSSSETGLEFVGGVLQLFAAVDGVEDGLLVPHRVAHAQASSLRPEALRRPRGVQAVAPAQLVGADAMATLPHEDDVVEAESWDPRDRFDYRVLKQLLEVDPYARNPQVEFHGDSTSPAQPGFRPVVPIGRLGGYPLVSQTRMQVAAEALDCEPAKIYPLLDLPLRPDDAAIADPNRDRLVVLMRRGDLKTADFSRTVAMRYEGPHQPLPHEVSSQGRAKAEGSSS